MDMSFSNVRNWLTIFRIHTANLTMAAVAIGLLVAGESLFTPISGLFLLWGLIFHAQGFMENCILDLDADRNDPSKKHFALVAGKITPRDAQTVQTSLLVGGLLLGAIICVLQESWIGLVMMGLVHLSGTVYNHVSKHNLSATLWIMVTYTAVVLFPYVVMETQEFSILMGLVALCICLQIAYQISVEGYMKDLLVDPVNLMRTLGCRCKDFGILMPDGARLDVPERSLVVEMNTCKVYKVGRPAFIYATVLKTIHLTLLSTTMWYLLALTDWSLVWGCVLGSILLLFSMLIITNHCNMMRPRDTLGKYVGFNNATIVRYCSKIEVLSYFGLVIALWPLIGGWYVALLIFAPLVWFLVMNQLTWGAWRPRV